MAILHALKELIWIHRLLKELGYDVSNQNTISTDSQSAIALAKNPEHHARTKHIDVQYHFIREHVEANQVQLSYISTHEIATDGLTKPLPRLKFQQFVNILGMCWDCS